MKILPILLIIALATAAVGDEISDIVNKKLEVKKYAERQEKELSENLSKIQEKLRDSTEVQIIDKIGNAKIGQTTKNRTIQIEILEGNPIKKVKLNNVRGQNHTLKIDAPRIPFTKQAYAIDPSAINFTDGEIEVIAKGNQLYKCPTWNFTTGNCEQICKLDEETQEKTCETPWIYQKDIIPGETYTIGIYPGDPAFYEIGVSIDVSLAPINETAFLTAFIDNSQLDASVRIFNTNGSIIINTTDIDQNVTNIARIDAATINSTDFIITWINGTGFLFVQQFRHNTTTIFNTTSRITVDNLIGTNTDNSVTVMSDRYAICYANDDDDDADFKIYSFTGTQLVGETNVDANMGPESTLQNLIDCSSVNSTRFAYAQFDDNTVNDMSFALINNAGTTATAQTDVDTDVGETAQVALTALEPTRFGMVFYDSTDQDVTITIRNGANTVILAPQDIDLDSGASSRVAAGTVRRNSTETEDLLVAAWQDTSDNTIKAAVYFQNGTVFTAPFNVTTTANSSFQLIDVLGREPVTGLQLCPGRFIVAFSNNSGVGEFKRYMANGSTWNGICIDNTGPVLTNAEPEGHLYSNSLKNLSIQIDAEDSTDVQKVEARITLPNGTNQTRNLTFTGGVTYTGNFSISALLGRYNVTYFANDSFGNSNTYTTFFEVGQPANGVRVQRGYMVQTGTVFNATINSTPINQTFILFTASTASASAPNVWQMTPEMPNSTTIRFETYSAGVQNISWEAIYSPDIRVQRGTIMLATGNNSASIDINPVNMTHTFVLVNGRCNSGTAGNSPQGFFLANLTNSTRVELRRGQSGNCEATAHYQVVSWPNARVQKGSGTILSNTAGFTTSIDTVNTNSSFIVLGWASVGTDAGMDTNLLQANIGTTGKTVTIQHLPTAQIANSDRDVTYYVVELPESYVQNDEISLNNDINKPTSAVATERSFITLSWYNNGGGNTYANSRLTAQLTNSTNIYFFTSTATTVNTIRYFLTETPQRCIGAINSNTILTKNISAAIFQGESCIIINASNIELDCNGNTITGSQIGNGIFIQNKNNITIKNCIINNFEINIEITNTTASKYINNTILNATRHSVREIQSKNNIHTNSTYNNQLNGTYYLENTNNTNVTNTRIQSTSDAIYSAPLSSGNQFINISVNSTGRGIVLNNSNSETIADSQINTTTNHGILIASPNIIINNTRVTTSTGTGIEVRGNNTIINRTTISTTTANGILTNGASDLKIDNTNVNVTSGNAIGMVLTQTTNITNSNLFASTNGNGILFFAINTTRVSNSNLTTSSGFGLNSFAGIESTIVNTNIRSNLGFGISLDATSVNNNFINVVMETNNTWIRTTSASTNNTFTNTTYLTPHGSIRITPSIPIPINTTINTNNLNITFNKTFLNDTNLTFLNVSSQITLHGLNFTQAFPAIDRTDNGSFVLCSAPICINQSYNGSTFIFNVTGHSSYAAIGNSPPIIHNATIVPSTTKIGNNACIILNATDSDGIANITAKINPPIGANQTLILNEGLSCNSVPGDNLWTNIYFPTIDSMHTWIEVNITDNLGVTTAHVINISFDGIISVNTLQGIHPPTLAAYNDGTNFNVSLINESDDVYATQLLPALSNTFMYFNWTQFNFTDEQIKNAVIIVEHSYLSILGLNVTLQIWNGTNFATQCSFTPSLTDTINTCNITSFINTTLLNSLRARLSGNTGLLGLTQNVDYFVLNLTTNSPPTIEHDLNKTYLLDETAILRVNVTDPENDTITDVNAIITSPDGTIFFYNLSNLTNANVTWDANHTNMKLKGRYNVTISATDNTSTTRTIETFFIRKAFDIIDIIEPNEQGTPTLQNFSFHNYTTTIVQNQSNILDLSINLSGTIVKQINITEYNDSSPHSIIELSDQANETNFPQTAFTNYEINPEGLEFNYATLLLNATGNSTLMKCSNYNFTEGACFEGNWTEHLNITRGELYTLTINATDPAFIETTAAGDVAMSPLNNTMFLIGFVDIAQTDVSFEIIQTNGSIIVNTTDVDTTVSTNSRVDVSWINSSHFVILWADNNENDATFQIWSFNGTNVTNTTSPIDVDTSIGNTNVDVSIAMLNNRFITCYANDADSDADFRAFNFSGTQVVGETAVDGNIQPSSPLQNLIDCSATNFTRWTYFWFDDSVDNDATYQILNETGGTIVTATDIDTDVGETGQVAVIGLNNNLSGLVWYDSTDQDITIAGVNNSGTTIFGPTDVDTGAGTESRVAAAAVRQNKTSTDQLFTFAWWSQSNATIKAAVYRPNGTQFTAPFNVSTTINSTFPLIDITGRDNITGQEICPGTFLVAFSNSSTGQFLGFWVNGTPWNGTCPTDLIATQLNVSNLNPGEQENVTFNGSIFNNGTSNAFNFVAALVNGNCTNGTMIQNTTINLSAGQNTTLNFSWNATPVGPHNISFCVNYINNILEDNYTNNNITITLNVKAYNDYFGNITGNVTLDTNTNRTEYDWNFTDSGNVIFTTANKTINFSALYALGRNISGGIAVNDFLEADQALNMTGFNDSIQILWATNASNPKQTTNFTIRGRLIQNVPYINSTNTSNFITGILWQSANSTVREFNATNNAPLLFVTVINRNQTGFYGRYDYEAHVPVLLRVYNSTANALQYFVELR